jgi:ribosomal protein S18 acetylase RimI-like enzyme
MSRFSIRFLLTDDCAAYASHLARHMSESGMNDIIYTPYPIGYVHDEKIIEENTRKRLQTPLTSVNWERAFVAWDGDKIVAHLDLRGGSIESNMHRCRLGIGMDKELRGQGLGKELMQTAIDWAQKQLFLDYIDLYVFQHNTPAMKLYEKMGFEYVGIQKDIFRVGGEIINDVSMEYKL